jgi:hypothetical protein
MAKKNTLNMWRAEQKIRWMLIYSEFRTFMLTSSICAWNVPVDFVKPKKSLYQGRYDLNELLNTNR